MSREEEKPVNVFGNARYNIERVEVVKVPASFLHGQVAPGGIVAHLRTAHPQFAASAR